VILPIGSSVLMAAVTTIKYSVFTFGKIFVLINVTLQRVLQMKQDEEFYRLQP
jgi:hypothetical protein